MSSTGTDSVRAMQSRGEGRWAGFPRYGPPSPQGNQHFGLLVTGLVALGLGVLAWNYFGPDLRRYIKIERM